MFKKKLAILMVMIVTLTSIGFSSESVYAEDREPVKLVLDEGVTHLAINGKLLYSEENNIDLINSNFNLIVPYGSQVFLDYGGGKFNAYSDSLWRESQSSLYVYADTVVTPKPVRFWAPLKESNTDYFTNNHQEVDFSVSTTTSGAFNISISNDFGDDSLVVFFEKTKYIKFVYNNEEFTFSKESYAIIVPEFFNDDVFLDISSIESDETGDVQQPLIIGEHNGKPIIDIYSGLRSSEIGELQLTKDEDSLEELLNVQPDSFEAPDIYSESVKPIAVPFLKNSNDSLPFSFKQEFLENMISSVPDGVIIPIEEIEEAMKANLFSEAYRFLKFNDDIPQTTEIVDNLIIYEFLEQMIYSVVESLFDAVEIDEDRYRAALAVMGFYVDDLEGSDELFRERAFYELEADYIEPILEELNTRYPSLNARYEFNEISEDSVEEDKIRQLPTTSLNTSFKQIDVAPHNYARIEGNTIILDTIESIDLTQFSYKWVLTIYQGHTREYVVSDVNSGLTYDVNEDYEYSACLVIMDAYGFPYFTMPSMLGPIEETNFAAITYNMDSSVRQDSAQDYMYYDLTNSSADYMRIDFFNKELGLSTLDTYFIDVSQIREFYIPKLIPADGIFLTFCTSTELPDDTAVNELLFADGKLISTGELETYTSPLTGNESKAYKIQAIKNGRYLQSMILEYSDRYHHKPVLKNIQPFYGDSFTKNIDIFITGDFDIEGPPAYTLKSGFILEGEGELNLDSIEDAYIYVTVDDIISYVDPPNNEGEMH